MIVLVYNRFAAVHIISIIKQTCILYFINRHMYGGQGCIVGVVNMLLAGQSVVPISTGARGFFLLQMIYTGCQTHSASYSVGTSVLSWG